MVDFNNSETMTTAPRIVIQFMILERYNNLLESFEAYNRQSFKGHSANTYEIQTRLKTLFRLLEGAIIQDQKNENIEIIKSLIDSSDFKDHEKVLNFFTKWLHSKKLLDIFTGKKYDSTDMEMENNVNGL